MKKKFIRMLSTALLAIGLCSCGTRVPSGSAVESGYEDGLSVSDIKVTSVYNSKETENSSIFSNYSSYLEFEFNVSNIGDKLCTSFNYEYNIADSTGTKLFASNVNGSYRYDGYFMYPGEYADVFEKKCGNDSYSFTTAETYSIVDFKVLSANYYKTEIIYSTEKTDDSKIEISNLRVTKIDRSGSTSTEETNSTDVVDNASSDSDTSTDTKTKVNLYRIDFKADYKDPEGKNKTGLSYIHCVLKIGDESYGLSEISSSSAFEHIGSTYLETTDELDLTKELKLTMKGCVTYEVESNYERSFTSLLITILVLIPCLPVVGGLIALIIVLCDRKKKKKQNEQK